ncbi:hypothetical protein EB796_002800 [Bugula neritina]|uniref:G-protein coupled receptors family 1 profile domain-containing protein n=1 Tax=Bugula neritina TaxID=10212 RepID=A0A7J7KKR6_BUGNE|nr:hypothetical protein EB796_002800 [Bugula neritina]
MKLFLGLIWIFTFALTTIAIGTDFADYCFGEFGAIPSEPNKLTSFFFGGSITAAFVTSAICLSKAWKELKRMQSRNAAPGQDDLIVKRSAQYIMIVFITLYLSYIPTIISVVCNSVDAIPNSLGYLARWISFFYVTFFSILNTALYFFMTPGYRVHVMNLLKLRNATVRPN